MRMAYERDRGSARQRGYTAQWDKQAKRYLAEYPLCCGCEAIGRVEPATLVDHIEPHRGSRAKFWDEGNWQPSCDWHHNAVKPLLERLFDEGQIGADDLRLTSARAIEVTRQTPRKPLFVGTDGWTIG